MFLKTKSAISSMSLFLVLLRDFFVGREVEAVGRHDLGISASPSSELKICGGIAGTLNPTLVIKGDSLA